MTAFIFHMKMSYASACSTDHRRHDRLKRESCSDPRTQNGNIDDGQLLAPKFSNRRKILIWRQLSPGDNPPTENIPWGNSLTLVLD